MRAILAILLAIFSMFGYEIRHENTGEIFKIIGDADREKFEIFVDFFDVEFENFKNKNELVLPPKINGRLFFKGTKLDFTQGGLERNGAKISALNAQSKWLNLELKSSDDGELIGKLAVKGKAMKAAANAEFTYQILAEAVQILDANGTNYEAIISDFYAAKFQSKVQKSLQEELKNTLKTRSENTAYSKIKELFYQNEIFKSACEISSKTSRTCGVTLAKSVKKLPPESVFKDLRDENLLAIFAKNKINPNSNFTLSPAGICFYDGDEICVPLDEVKPFFKQNFGL